MIGPLDPGCPYDFEKSSKKFENNDTKNFKNAGIRFHEMKLLLGNPGKPDGWIPPAEVVDLPDPEIEFNSIVNHYFSSNQDMFCEFEPVKI